MALTILLTTMADLMPLGVGAQGPSASVEEKALQDAAKTLGWPTTVDQTPLIMSGQDSEALFMLWPPGSAVRYFNKPVYTVTNGGDYEKETIQYLRVYNLGEQGSSSS